MNNRDIALQELSLAKASVAKAIAKCEIRIEACREALDCVRAAVNHLGLAEENVRNSK